MEGLFQGLFCFSNISGSGNKLAAENRAAKKNESHKKETSIPVKKPGRMEIGPYASIGVIQPHPHHTKVRVPEDGVSPGFLHAYHA
jgi:hypothetical protein